MKHDSTLACHLLELNRIDRTPLVDFALILGGSLLVAATAQVAIPLPFTPVPITGQTFGVLLCGAALGAKRGFFAVALYLIEGAIGLPFFANGASGITHALGPTGGYLLGFLLAAAVCGWVADWRGERTVRSAIPAFAAAQFVIYLVGMPWLGFYVGFENIWSQGFLPFLPGLAIKSTLAGLLLPAAWRKVERARNG